MHPEIYHKLWIDVCVALGVGVLRLNALDDEDAALREEAQREALAIVGAMREEVRQLRACEEARVEPEKWWRAAFATKDRRFRRE